ncbi:DUF2285 domain-containing protein [Phenylobacterium sp. 58.2.17]|jgi:hypothetical protein|uniref:DUF2285 domain-containing protein n=1 Tax=Phenylobacterium sp. 58.2.17 TaxID=2969306 RepID=UPI002264A964|nr:DUF2285 domain-containing protein [Phenylobacterium sp. 58.2.17]MCX7586362.1 DUF2285 domain-containing protein [Phenylobacterium sp. 58.2.17]
MADASAAQVFWCPETAPTSVVWLRPSAGSSGLPLSSSADVIAQRRTVEGLHLRLRGGLQVYVEGGDPSAPLAAMIPIAGSFSAALKGARDLDRILSGGVISEDLTLQQQVRLRRSLIALDAVQAQATYRQIAVQIFGPEAVARYDWRTSSIRDAAIRLVRTGRAMADGGYMRLLGGASS